MKKIFKYPLIILFLGIIFLVPILSLTSEGKTMSEIENRSLAIRPEYSKENLLSGEYFSQWEEYTSDHIYGRDQWIKQYALLNMNVLQKKRINDIVLGKEDTLLPYYTEELSEKLNTNFKNLPQIISNMERLNQLTEEYGAEFIFVGVPGQSSFFRDRYHDYFENKADYFIENEKLMFQGLEDKNIGHINMNKVFREDYKENYYLKTDHHFAFEGFFKTYEEIIKKASLEPLPKDKWDITTLDRPINGSRSRQIYYLNRTDDRLKTAYPKEKVAYSKYVNGRENNTLYYIDENLEENPSYEIYMGGDHAEIVISTSRKDLPSLLLFGDSFTNALGPLLFNHFDETRILDLRHYEEKSLEEYITIHRPDFVVLVRDDLNYGNIEGNGNF